MAAAAALYFSHFTKREAVEGGRGKKPCGMCTTLCDGLLFFYQRGNEGKNPRESLLNSCFFLAGV